MSPRQENGERWPLHEIVHEFPAMDKESCDEMQDSFRVVGQVQPLLIWKDPTTGITYIVDGKHRYETALANEDKKIKAIDISDLPPDAMREYVFAANLFRRHLTDDQRRALAARLTRGGAVTFEKAARIMKVSKTGTARAAKVQAASTETFQEVVDGKITLAAAEEKEGIPVGTPWAAPAPEPQPPQAPAAPQAAPAPAGPRPLAITLTFIIPTAAGVENGLFDPSGGVDATALSSYLRPVHNAVLDDLEIYESKHTAE
jgi:hypothetical protein